MDKVNDADIGRMLHDLLEDHIAGCAESGQACFALGDGERLVTIDTMTVDSNLELTLPDGRAFRVLVVQSYEPPPGR